MNELNLNEMKSVNGGFEWPWEKWYRDHYENLIK